MPSKKNTAAVSAKLTDLMQMVEDLLGEGRKILVFSQFTTLMDILETVLETLDIRFMRLDGHNDISDTSERTVFNTLSTFDTLLKIIGQLTEHAGRCWQL